VAREAKEAGALYLTEAPLLLGSHASEPFFRFLRREFPSLDRAYREAFDASARVPEAYRRKVAARAARARRKYGLRARASQAKAKVPRASGPRPPPEPRQLEFAF
jgi:hypothetical protein